MTQKHFIALADHIRTHRTDWPPYAILSLADHLAREFPAFNRGRWIDYIDGKCGPNGVAIHTAAASPPIPWSALLR